MTDKERDYDKLEVIVERNKWGSSREGDYGVWNRTVNHMTHVAYFFSRERAEAVQFFLQGALDAEYELRAEGRREQHAYFEREQAKNTAIANSIKWGRKPGGYVSTGAPSGRTYEIRHVHKSWFVVCDGAQIDHSHNTLLSARNAVAGFERDLQRKLETEG